MTKIFSIFRNVAARVLLVAVLAEPSASAGYSSIYVFGDGVCTTTQNPPPAPSSLYFGARFCNGPVWIEVISGLMGLTYEVTKNNSFFGHDSSALLTSTASLAPPADAATSLFIVWSANADFVNFSSQISAPYGNMTPWNNAISQSLSNHSTAVTTLYNKGARKIVMPNAADIMAVPFYNSFAAGDRTFARARVSEFNAQFTTMLNNLESTLPGLVIIRPDMFSFFDNILGNPSAYDMVNPNPYVAPFPNNAAILNEDISSPWVEGIHFVFWDDYHPTAKFQSELANYVNSLLTISDTVPPVLTLPGNLAKASTGPDGAVVTFLVSAEDAVDGPVTATALPASGSQFPIGTTTVNVSASDAAGNEASGSFKVTVVDLANLLNHVTITPAGAGSPAISGSILGGPPGGEVILQASTDLGISDAWRDLSVIQLDESGGQTFGPIQDPQGAGLKRDFFRIKLPLSP